MAAQVTKLGPGSLELEATPTTQDMSCQLSSAWVKWDKDKDDNVPVLCGEEIAGDVVYSGKLTGTIFIDLSDGGLVEYTWANKGTQVPFRFVPNTAAGKEITGTVTIDPLDVGGDEMKKNMTADFEWDCVGEPDMAAVTP